MQQVDPDVLTSNDVLPNLSPTFQRRLLLHQFIFPFSFHLFFLLFFIFPFFLPFVFLLFFLSSISNGCGLFDSQVGHNVGGFDLGILLHRMKTCRVRSLAGGLLHRCLSA